MSEQTWKVLKWFGVVCFSFSTIIMLNPQVAATSITPWVLFVIGNIIWVWSSFKRDWALFGLCAFYLMWDILLTISRIVPHFFDSVQFIIDLMGKIP